MRLLTEEETREESWYFVVLKKWPDTSEEEVYAVIWKGIYLSDIPLMLLGMVNSPVLSFTIEDALKMWTRALASMDDKFTYLFPEEKL